MLIVGADNFMDIHRRHIISQTAKYAVPAIYHLPDSARDGGLISEPTSPTYSIVLPRYADRILRGDKASELPVQMPVKYLTIINLQTAKALGLAVPPALLVSADEVIVARCRRLARARSEGMSAFAPLLGYERIYL